MPEPEPVTPTLFDLYEQALVSPEQQSMANVEVGKPKAVVIEGG